MPIKIFMPALSPTMEAGVIAKWLKKEGDKIKIGDVLAEIETDKATMELESIEDGILGKIIINAGVPDVKVNSLIAIIIDEGEDYTKFANFESESTAIEPINTSSLLLQEQLVKAPEAKSMQLPLESDSTKAIASPLAKRLALQNNLDLKSLVGSGPLGRIIKDDILKALQSNSTPLKASGNNSIALNNTITPHSNIRKVIAQRLLAAKQTIPHFYLTIDCKLDKLMHLRKEINEAGELKISVNDFIIKATSLALKKVPEVNSSWSDEGMINYSTIDISVAVSTPSGLITPIIFNADSKSLESLSSEMKSLAIKAKENKLKPSEYQGGGFTISNLGMFNIQSFIAIINPPQSCILAIGAGQKKAIVDNNDNITIANIMSVTLSCDHRVVDGVVAAKWLNEFRNFIENPILMII